MNGNYMEALNHFAKIGRQTAVTYGNKAMCYYKLCQWQQAIAECDLALQLDSIGHGNEFIAIHNKISNNLVWIYICKGLCLEQLQDFEKAYTTLLQAKRLDTEKKYMKDILPPLTRLIPYITNVSSGSVRDSEQTPQQQSHSNDQLFFPVTYKDDANHIYSEFFQST